MRGQNKEKNAMNLIQFGAKVAQAQSAQELVDAAKDVKDEADASGKLVVKKLDSAKNKKTAASSCAPCDMPNGPTNKKHMTGASPAVLEADEASEEIKPKTTETKHDKSIVTGGKEARTKRAAGGVGLPPVNPAINIQLPSVHDVAKQTALFTAPLGAVVGGAIGGFGSKKDKLRNTLLGALKGTAVGAAGGAGTVYGGRYLPELIGNMTGASAAVPSAVLAGGAGGGLLAGGLTGAGFDAIAGNKEEEEPKKQAQAFGAAVKRSFDLENLTGKAPPAPMTNRLPVGLDMPPRTSPYVTENVDASDAGAVAEFLKQRAARAQNSEAMKNWLPKKPRPILDYGGERNMLDSVIDGGVSAVNAVTAAPGKAWGALNSVGKSMADYGGERNMLDSVIDAGSAPYNALFGRSSPPPDSSPIRMPSPAVKPPAGKPGMFDGLKNIDARTALMYGLPIGLGGAGLYGLYNYLNSKPKKKTEDEKEKA
jgi:hypothetical protein